MYEIKETWIWEEKKPENLNVAAFLERARTYNKLVTNVITCKKLVNFDNMLVKLNNAFGHFFLQKKLCFQL